MILERLKSKETKLSVIGLGYVGLPIALEFAKLIKVVGLDINHERVEMMRNNQDPSKELDTVDFEGADILFTSDSNDLRQADFHIVAVPTPIDEYNNPDLRPLLSACKSVGQVLKKGDYVVFESTVYPGCTEEDCVPILEKESGLSFVEDFKVGFSPERINPGDKVNTLTSIVKVSSGCDIESAENIAQVYEMIINAGVHRASSIKVAEAAKIIENTQRDVNIALMNELSLIFDKLKINTYDVLEAAGTKWNFLKFFPGLVGGHCIGVDPYYLVHKAHNLGYHPQVISSGRSVNDRMGKHVAQRVVKELIKKGKSLQETRVLVMGVTFKENVSDIRNSKVIDVIRELREFSVHVDVVDPCVDSEEVLSEYGIEMTTVAGHFYDAVIVAVSHKEFLDYKESDFVKLTGKDGFFVDVKGAFKNQFTELKYWSL